MADVVPIKRSYALVVWSLPDFSFACIAVSSNRKRLEALCTRLLMFVQHDFRVIETPSLDDEAVEAAGLGLPWPEEVAFLHHEADGIS